ncbi:MAG TPA: hypothetical protein PL084_13785, partial [Chitinophagales bacterium]|nr:hypothetical protein [Chitinophagales bacterium]
DTFYAAASTGGSGAQTFGANDPSIGSIGTWTATAQWVNFTVLSPTVIQSVDMYWTAALNSPFSIVIRDAGSLANVFTYNGTVTATNSSTYTNAQVIPLNASLAPGNYQINLGTNPGTIRNGAGGVYPYTIPGVISITGNTFDQTYYYMFYRWVIGSGCEGSRIPVVATVTTPPAYTLSATPPTICTAGSTTISISSANNYTYSWTPTGSGSSFSVSPTTTTKYYVSGTDGNNCSILDSITINVVAPPATTIASAAPASICQSGSTTLSLILTPMAGIDIQWERNTGSGWSNIAGATTASFTEPVTATTAYRANLYCNNSIVATTNIDTVTYSNPLVAQTFPGERCGAGPVTLAAIGGNGASINWYSAATGGSVLASGNAFTTPSIASTTTYYAAAT